MLTMGSAQAPLFQEASRSDWHCPTHPYCGSAGSAEIPPSDRRGKGRGRIGISGVLSDAEELICSF